MLNTILWKGKYFLSSDISWRDLWFLFVYSCLASKVFLRITRFQYGQHLILFPVYTPFKYIKYLRQWFLFELDYILHFTKERIFIESEYIHYYNQICSVSESKLISRCYKAIQKYDQHCFLSIILTTTYLEKWFKIQ